VRSKRFQLSVAQIGVLGLLLGSVMIEMRASLPIMSQPDGKIRPWRQIARELMTERDSQRILALCKELNVALLTQAVDVALIESDPQPKSSTGSDKPRNG